LIVQREPVGEGIDATSDGQREMVDDAANSMAARLAADESVVSRSAVQRRYGETGVPPSAPRSAHRSIVPVASLRVGEVVRRATVIDVNGVGHSEDDSNITTDANGVMHDAAGNVVTFRAPDGVFVEQPSTSNGANQSQAPADSTAPIQSTDPNAPNQSIAPGGPSQQSQSPDSNGNLPLSFAGVVVGSPLAGAPELLNPALLDVPAELMSLPAIPARVQPVLLRVRQVPRRP
jgi:hypothetical protein